MSFISQFCKSVWSFVYIIIYCAGAGKSTLMSISDGLGSYFFHRKMARTWPMREELDGKVFICRQSWHQLSLYLMIKVLFPICTSTWRVNNYVSRQGECINRRNKGTININNKLLHCTVLQLMHTCKNLVNWLTVVAWKPAFVENNNF